MNSGSDSVEEQPAIPAWLLGPLLAAATAALAGGYWDDAWHTERGRDSFFIAPHIAIYGGISLAGAALSCWVLLAIRAQGVKATLRHRPLALALIAVGLTFASGPIDNAWHLAFGRDAVIWSPPHTLGIVGTAGLGVALLVELFGTRANWARWARPVAGAFVLAALTFLVVEYETDVPQFDAVWYLPVLGLTSALALAITRRVTLRPWAASEGALVHLAFVGAVSLLLFVLGFDTPKLPLLVAPALVLDVCARRGLPLAWQAPGYSFALFGLYVPTVNWLGQGVQLNGADVLVAFPLTVVAVAVVLAAAIGERGPSVPGRLATTVVIGGGALLIFPAGVLAHDPGQGADAGTVALTARTLGREIVVTAAPTPAVCTRLGQGRLVARRGGVTKRVPMRRFGCRYRGRLSVPQRGRWFVYAELKRSKVTVESWVPVKVGDDQMVSDPERYAYVADATTGGLAKTVIGGALYLLMLATLAAMIVLVRRASGAIKPSV